MAQTICGVELSSQKLFEEAEAVGDVEEGFNEFKPDAETSSTRCTVNDSSGEDEVASKDLLSLLHAERINKYIKRQKHFHVLLKDFVLIKL